MSAKARAHLRVDQRIYTRASSSRKAAAGQSSSDEEAQSTSRRKTSTPPPIPQPTTMIPLTTTFTPPASCSENRLSQLPPPGYFIWANEPVPAKNVTSSACFPSEFLKAYTSVTSLQGTVNVGSSVVPAMSPFACPANYCTMYAGDNNYVACCPSGYELHRPDTTIDPKRPGYGGTCYTSLTISSTYTVTAYNVTGATNIAPWYASTTSLQAYAHPIDGFASVPPVVGCPTPKSSSQPKPTPHSSPSPTAEPQSSHVSRSTIAGATVGALSGFALFLTLILLLLRRIRRNRKPPPVPLKIRHIEHDNVRRAAVRRTVLCETGGTTLFSDMGGSETYGQKEDSTVRHGPFEMSGDTVAELDARGMSVKGKSFVEEHEVEVKKDEKKGRGSIGKGVP